MLPVRSWSQSLLLATLACSLLTNCERKKPAVNGLGPWVLGETRLSQAGGACTGDKVKFCSQVGLQEIGTQTAQVSLYFAGDDADPPLIEIALQVRACKPEALASALAHVLGEPKDQKGNKYFWPGELAFVAADFAGAGRLCEINFVSHTDSARIASLSE